MIEIKSKLRRWGNSFGIVVPQSVLKEKEGLKENQMITVFISECKPDLKKLFGKLKNWKIDPQKFKDEIREEESKDELLS